MDAHIMLLLVGVDENKRCELKVDTLQILFYLSNESDFTGTTHLEFLEFYCFFVYLSWFAGAHKIN